MGVRGRILQQKNRERWNRVCGVLGERASGSEGIIGKVVCQEEEGGRETRKDPQDERDDEEWRGREVRDGLASWRAGELACRLAFCGPQGIRVKTNWE
jgi:hypothetical protein